MSSTIKNLTNNSDITTAMDDVLYAVLRVDTHGNRFIVEQNIVHKKAKSLEKHFDSMTHHQGYYIVKQCDIAEELKRP